MKVKVLNERLVKRWDSVMYDIGCEHLTINTDLSDLAHDPIYYGCPDGIDIKWMIGEAMYWLGCYSEVGNVRCDDRFLSEDAYKIWISERRKLQRLINLLGKEDVFNYVAVWKKGDCL